MNPGSLDRRITLRTFTSAAGATGQPVDTWTDLDMVWAKKTDGGGSETNRDGREIAKGTTVFTIRHRTDLTGKHRVRYFGVDYDVQFTRELGRSAYLELHTERSHN